MGLGAVITGPAGERHTLSLATGERGCNNEAELRAVMAALALAKAQGATRARVYCDNSVVVEQLGPRAVRPIVRLEALFAEARALLASFDDVAMVWIPRHRNAEADALARAALGIAPGAAA